MQTEDTVFIYYNNENSPTYKVKITSIDHEGIAGYYAVRDFFNEDYWGDYITSKEGEQMIGFFPFLSIKRVDVIK